MSLNNLTHQMWRDHPFSERNKATKRAVGAEVGSEGVDKICKKGGRQYRGVFIK